MQNKCSEAATATVSQAPRVTPQRLRDQCESYVGLSLDLKRLRMHFSHFFWATLFAMAATSTSANETSFLPSDPSTWHGDFLQRVKPTNECAGGTIAQVRKHMSVSAPYTSQEFEAAQDGSFHSVPDVPASDRLHSFSFRSELDDRSFWGFEGYLVARGECVIHVQVTSHDN
jgi:hypothetical protein